MRTFKEVVENEKYVSDDSWVMQREYGDLPHGMRACGRWVMRNAAGEVVDFDNFRYDLSERNDGKILDNV